MVGSFELWLMDKSQWKSYILYYTSYILKKLFPTTFNSLNMHTLYLIMHAHHSSLAYFSQHASMPPHHPTCMRKTHLNMPLCILKTHIQHACMIKIYFIMIFKLNPYISLKVIVSNIHASFNQTFSLKY